MKTGRRGFLRAVVGMAVAAACPLPAVKALPKPKIPIDTIPYFGGIMAQWQPEPSSCDGGFLVPQQFVSELLRVAVQNNVVLCGPRYNVVLR